MNNKCKRLGNRATKRELRDAHRVKMEMKNILREHNREQVLARGKEHISANLSYEHDNWGETPAENDRRMREKSS